MIAVIFEVVPHQDKKQRYLDLASELAAHLKTMKGFISVERFTSLTNPDKMLSLSFWESEEDIKTWRNLEAHRQAQHFGRAEVFANYRLRVASVLRDYGLDERRQAPIDSKDIHG